MPVAQNEQTGPICYGDDASVHRQISEPTVGATVENVPRSLNQGARDALKTLIQLTALCSGQEGAVKDLTRYTRFFLDLEVLAARLEGVVEPKQQELIAANFFAENFAAQLASSADKDLGTENGRLVGKATREQWASVSQDLCADYAAANAVPLLVMLADYRAAKKTVTRKRDACPMYRHVRFEIVHTTAERAEEPHVDPTMRRALRVNGLEGEDDIAGTGLWPPQALTSPYIRAQMNAAWFFRVKDKLSDAMRVIEAGWVIMLNGTQAGNFTGKTRTLADFPNGKVPGITLGGHQSMVSTKSSDPRQAQRVVSRLSSYWNSLQVSGQRAEWLLQKGMT